MAGSKLGGFLTEVSNWTWDQFCEAEKDKAYTSNEAMIFGLVRACAMRKMDAIKMSLDRLDGKLKTPIQIEYPKIFYLFPNAKLTESTKPGVTIAINTAENSDRSSPLLVGDLLPPPPPVEGEVSDLPSMGLRETLTEMADYPRDLPEAIIQLAQEAEWAVRDSRPLPDEIPKVKSVIAAHLLTLAQERNLDAIGSIFDQIDGKLAETIKLIGDDIYITSYAQIAPPGATTNADGVFQIEAIEAQNMWAAKLGAKHG